MCVCVHVPMYMNMHVHTQIKTSTCTYKCPVFVYPYKTYIKGWMIWFEGQKLRVVLSVVLAGCDVGVSSVIFAVEETVMLELALLHIGPVILDKLL